MLKTALQFSHQLLAEIIASGDTVVDATMGNGHDTLFLSNLVGTNGQVIAFDIQEQALLNTKERLMQHNALHNTKLIQQSHAEVDKYLTTPIKAAIFNLGYLPSGDKSIITTATSTITALEKLLEHLQIGGRIVLVLYYGHPGGNAEKESILDYTSKLDQHFYQVLTYQFINQKNQPPICLCINKIRA